MTLSQTYTLDRDAELTDRVRELIATTFVIDPEEVTDDLSQASCSRWTSLYHMMLMVVLEEQFELSLSVDEMTSMTSLGEIVRVVKLHQSTDGVDYPV